MFNSVSVATKINAVPWKQRVPSFVMDVAESEISEISEKSGISFIASIASTHKNITIMDKDGRKFQGVILNSLAGMLMKGQRYAIYYTRPDYYDRYAEIVCADKMDEATAKN